MNTSRKTRVWVGLVALAAAFAAGANAGRWLVVDDPAPSDVILVLAGETEQRPARALQLLDQGYGRRIVIDAPSAAVIYGFRELDLVDKYVKSLPQPAAIRICPIKGLSTRDESHEAEMCLEGESGNRILLVTSDFHTRRALAIFRHEIHGKSFSVAAAHDDVEFGTRWWTRREWAKTCLAEWQRLAWWTLVDRWR